MRAVFGVVTALLAAFASPVFADGRPGAFDFYVLVLTWSPSYCAVEPAARGSSQCREGAGYGFVAHGLWPQYERGFPDFCGNGTVERLPAALVEDMRDLMPDRHLVEHEWERHGTCSGLSPQAYFAATRAAFSLIRIPPVLAEPPPEELIVSARDAEDAFVAANPGLTPQGVAIYCADSWLEEVRICLTRELKFRACAEVDRHGCRQKRLSLPAPG